MADKDAFGERGRSLEEEHFRKRDRELVEKMRRAAAAEQARRDISEKTGLDDPQILGELQSLGFTPETVSLLPLVPLVQVAWAEGGVSSAERDLIFRLARTRGVAEGSAADQQLSEWLAKRPAAEIFARATRLISALLAAPTSGSSGLTADDLVRYCESIATASGGMFGIGRISAEERALLSTIAADLRRSHSTGEKGNPERKN
jgi:hypothetical protein